jgi:probable HAF family extracellular repeat protein
MRRSTFVLVLCGLGLGPALAALSAPGDPSKAEPSTQRYAVTDLGTLGGAQSAAFALNERAEVVGWAETAAGERHAFLYREGRISDLGTLPGYHRSEAYGINDRGDVVGRADGGALPLRDGGGRVLRNVEAGWQAVLWSGGAVRDLGPGAAWDINNRGEVIGHPPAGHGFLWTRAGGRVEIRPEAPDRILHSKAINEAGAIVGMFGRPSGSASGRVFEISPFLRKGAELRLLTPVHAGPPGTEACGLNERGDVVGIYPHLDGTAFFWKPGARAEDTPLLHLGTFNGKAMEAFGEHAGIHYSAAFDINERGLIVGEANVNERGFEDLRAFVWEDGKGIELNRRIDPASGWVLRSARAVNERGQIAGFGTYRGQQRAFLLTPERS